jgi:hypothetical protein
MRRLFAVVLAVTCVAAATPSFARGGGHGFHGGGFVRDPMIRALQNPRPPFSLTTSTSPSMIADSTLSFARDRH